jgi:uncharacterized protein YecE (DUF72 family)
MERKAERPTSSPFILHIAAADFNPEKGGQIKSTTYAGELRKRPNHRKPAILKAMVRVGPAGWTYADWRGIVYPAPQPRNFDPLEYIAGYFDTVEINSSFYGPPRPAVAKQWVERIRANPNFQFTAKLYRPFTHTRKPTPQDERDFRAGLEPIAAAGRLGAVVAQFPWSFKREPETFAYLAEFLRRFGEYPLVVEVRHSSWITDEVLDLLAESGAGLVNIDQPLFHRSVPPTAFATAKKAYVRLHGRNYQNWFSSTAGVKERYDYLYGMDELEPWTDRIRLLEREADEVFAIANNHHLGKAVVNALEIMALLKGQPVKIPPPLKAHYPVLQAIAFRDTSDPSQSPMNFDLPM